MLLFFSYCYFLQNPWNWNSIPRVALGISLVENASLDINEFHKATSDKALYKGNYYSDKAPGMTFTAIPAIVASKMFLDFSRGDYKWVNQNGNITADFIFIQQIATIATSGLMTALAALALYFIAIRMGMGLGAATFGALAYGLATPAWGWATAFFGHGSAGACLFLGLALILYLRDSVENKTRDLVLSFTCAALLSWAVLIEYTSAPASAIIGIYALSIIWNWDRKRVANISLSALAGASLFVLPLFVHNYFIYNDIFASGYTLNSDFPGMREGYFGITTPKMEVLFNLLFSSYKGLFWFSPLLLFVPLALYRIWQLPGQKGLVLTITSITLYYLLWNSGYFYWSGGGSLGPRYITPILPFLCFALAMLWFTSSRVLKGILIVFFGVSFLITLASVSISMTTELTPNVNAVLDYVFPRFYDANNLQTSLLLKLIFPSMKDHNHLALLPLYIVIVSGLSYIIWQLRSAHRESSPYSTIV